MIIKSLQLKNIKSFADEKFNFKKSIAIFSGRNNSGKSTALQSLLFFQLGHANINNSWLRKFESNGKVEVEFFDQESGRIFQNLSPTHFKAELGANLKLFHKRASQPDWMEFSALTNMVDRGFLVPLLSLRNQGNILSQTNASQANMITGNYIHLGSKIEQIMYIPEDPICVLYTKFCSEMFGFVVRLKQTNDGRMPGLIIDKTNGIDIQDMGAGVMQMVGMVADMLLNDNKVFLIEEPENDIHPKALRVLCDIILERSKCNQFIISTHSSTIIQGLGVGSDSELYKFNCELVNRLPVTTVISDVRGVDRLDVLADLGYSLSDFGLWEGYIIFEEQSAEYLFREVIFDWVDSTMRSKIRSIACKSYSTVEQRFESINHQMVNVHLAQVYKNKCLVLIDEGPDEASVLNKMKGIYCKGENGWSPEFFKALSKHDIEDYYPAHFMADVKVIKDELEWKRRQDQKGALVKKLVGWIKANAENECIAKNGMGELIEVAKIFYQQVSRK